MDLVIGTELRDEFLSWEVQAGANLGGLHPTAWADQNLWQLAAAPGFADAEEISDADLLAAVQARLADADPDA